MNSVFSQSVFRNLFDMMKVSQETRSRRETTGWSPPAVSDGKKKTLMRKHLLILLLMFIPVAAAAHDFWIEPSTFRPVVGDTVSASLRVGQNFMGDPIVRSPLLLESFVVRDAAGERPLEGDEYIDPAGSFKVTNPGLILIGYRSKPSAISLPAPRYEEYLRLEGLDDIVALRAARGETAKPGHERFFRFSKSLLCAGSCTKGVRAGHTFGFPFEVVPEANPYTLAGDTFSFRLLHESKPRGGSLVVAIHRDDPSLRMSVRSDSNGRVTFRLPKRGVWLIESVHLVPAPPGTNAEWDSLWASLTFEWSGGKAVDQSGNAAASRPEAAAAKAAPSVSSQ